MIGGVGTEEAIRPYYHTAHCISTIADSSCCCCSCDCQCGGRNGSGDGGDL